MSEETQLRSKVPAHLASLGLVDYLAKRFRYQTAEAWHDLILEGKVTVNGNSVPPETILRQGDLVSYSVILREPPVDRNIRILHEEGTFLVADKPGQLPSHADGNFIKNTFIYILGEMLRSKGWKGEAKLVHRLDRETSGLMVVAKDKKSHQALVQQFEKGLVEKEYETVVKGDLAEEGFEVAGAIGRDEQSEISVRQKVVPEGTPFSKPARTLFRKIAGLRGYTHLRCIPKTGRTNQIRVHLDSIGHPVVGDKLYGRTDAEFLAYLRHVKAGGDPGWKGVLESDRQLLHASKLAFAHPVTGQKISFAAELPADMKDFIENHQV
ncbi:MAG TPA: RluA family pseudouridine synthase [bacterium]|nr:RluA family pseudouridine synthase [bacterium]